MIYFSDFSAGGSWHALSLPALNADSDGWANFTLRFELPASVVNQSGSKIRMRFRGTAAEGLTLTKVRVGVKGASLFSFASTPATVTFSGSGSATVGAGAALDSDEISLTVTAGVALTVAIYIGSAPDRIRRYFDGGPGFPYAFKAGDDVASLTASGYTNTSQSTHTFESFEIFG